jgi:hypothetical protein
MAINEPVDCPHCGTTCDAMPDEKKARFENVPGALPGLENILNNIRTVRVVCTNPACLDGEGEPNQFIHEREVTYPE